MTQLRITVSSNNFSITHASASAKASVLAFSKKYIQYGFQRSGRSFHYAALRAYAARTTIGDDYRFHINCYEEFMSHLKTYGFKEPDMEIITKEYKPVKSAVFKVKSIWEDRDYQTPVIEYIAQEDNVGAKFVSLQTGDGKSYCAMRGMQDAGMRTVIIIKPMYVEKWVEDIHRTYDIDPDRVLSVAGSADLMKLFEMGRNDEIEADIIIISNKTLLNYYKAYEEHGQNLLDMGYDCLPQEMFEHLGVGFKLIDEVHQDFHFNFKTDLYTHVKKSLSLSATLVGDDDFVNRMYALAYPMSKRYKAPPYKKYVAATGMFYSFRHPNRIKFNDYSSKNYSHHAFEQSVLKASDLTENYFKLIKATLNDSYLKNYIKGQRAIIFCASIDMCTKVKDYLNKIMSTFEIRRYVEDDPYENLMEPDIIVTTLLSAGTAVDIPNLTTVVLTTAISSSQSNIQSLGRLRKLKCGTTPEFIYFVCLDIPKHVEYHKRKREMLDGRALSFRETTYAHLL